MFLKVQFTDAKEIHRINVQLVRIFSSLPVDMVELAIIWVHNIFEEMNIINAIQHSLI